MLDLRREAPSPDRLEDVCLSGTRGPDKERSYPVDELRFDDGVITLRRPPGLSGSLLSVWTRTVSPRFLLDRLAQGLRAVGPAPLAEALANGQLAGPPTSTSTVPGLLPEQTRALRACLSPGVRLVWGPPGTGKTRVLASAIEELVRQSRRVLLVSTANIAVDNALHEVVRRLSAKPGTAIRVGPPQLPDIAKNPDVQLERLAASESVAVDQERDDVAVALRELDTQDTEIVAVRAELADYDDGAYRQAAARVDAAGVLDDLEPRLREAGDAVASAERARSRALDALRTATTAQEQLEVVRRAMDHEREAAAGLERLDRDLKALEVERHALAVQEPAGWFGPSRRARKLARATNDVHRFVADTADRRTSLLKLRRDARAVIGTVTPGDLVDADHRVEAAQAALDDLERRRTSAGHALEGLRRAAATARAIGPVSRDDRDLVAQVEQRGLPAAHRRLVVLEERQRESATRRGVLEERHRTLVDRSRKLRTDAEAQLVREARVVATTLARSRVHRAIATETFDVVLVDEAGAATLAEVVLALCRARTTAVLFGDFLQLGPVLEKPIQSDQDIGIGRWVRSTCFSRVGIRQPQDAIDHPGCTALRHQFRFGPELRRLANEVVYEVLRDADELPAVTARGNTDIVVVDVSTVPHLAEVRVSAGGGKWWLAGVVLGRALVELHVPDGRVGLVTPYRPQAEVALQALEDRKIVAGAAVGTVHSSCSSWCR